MTLEPLKEFDLPTLSDPIEKTLRFSVQEKDITGRSSNKGVVLDQKTTFLAEETETHGMKYSQDTNTSAKK